MFIMCVVSVYLYPVRSLKPVFLAFNLFSTPDSYNFKLNKRICCYICIAKYSIALKLTYYYTLGKFISFINYQQQLTT